MHVPLFNVLAISISFGAAFEPEVVLDNGQATLRYSFDKQSHAVFVYKGAYLPGAFAYNECISPLNK